MITLDPYWILAAQSSPICIFSPRTWLHLFQFLEWRKQSEVYSGFFCMPASQLGIGLSQWGLEHIHLSHILNSGFKSFWILYQMWLQLSPTKTLYPTLGVMVLGLKDYFTDSWLNALLGKTRHGDVERTKHAGLRREEKIGNEKTRFRYKPPALPLTWIQTW